MCRRRKRENDFGRTFLKLRWVVIGWLPSLSFPVTDTDSRYTSFTYMTIFTLYWLQEHRRSVRFSRRVKQRGNVSLFGRCVSLMATWHTAGRGSDVTSALTVPLSSREQFLKLFSCIKWWWHLQLQLCPVTGSASFNDQIKKKNQEWSWEMWRPFLLWSGFRRH